MADCNSEQIEALETAAAETAKAGIQNVSVDGLSVSQMDPMKQLDVADRLRRRCVSNPFATLRHTRIISPGGGG